MFKMIVGITLSLLIGAGCRRFDISVLSPPKVAGALLVVAMTLGYMATDKLITTRFSSKDPASTREMCGGPTDEVNSSPGSGMLRPKTGDRKQHHRMRPFVSPWADFVALVLLSELHVLATSTDGEVRSWTA
jgi:XapX domain-containing protein